MKEIVLAAATALCVYLSLAPAGSGPLRRAGRRAVVARLRSLSPPAPSPTSERRRRRDDSRRGRLSYPFTVRSGIVLLVAGAAGTAWGWVVFGTPPLALICGVAAGIGTRQVLARHVPSGRGPSAERLRGQLPEALALQACALRAGQSMIGSLKVVASELGPPLEEAVALAVQETELGTSLVRALENFALRAEGREPRLWVTAMLVHHQTGGDLARLLDTVADRLRQADQLRRELRALSAQGRLSGLVMAVGPLAFFALISVTAREQVRPIVSTLPGVSMLLAGLILDLAGFLWIRRILRIQI